MTKLLIPPDDALGAALAECAREATLVFMTGLPGTGKSLITHQLAHLAHAAGRAIHLLQWDVARSAFEDSEHALRHYPIADGVTHGMVRVAAGLWAREAAAGWHAAHARDGDLLIGELPLVGHRLIELVRPLDDDAEPLLTSPSARFIVPVPSAATRAHIERERERRMADPLHEREKNDAPMHVLQDAWFQLAAACRALGIAGAALEASQRPAYDPVTYRNGFMHLLAHRRAAALPNDRLLDTAGMSAYDYAVQSRDVLPSPADVGRAFARAEALNPTPDALDAEIEGWYVV